MVKINGQIGSVMMVFTGESPEQIIQSGVVTTPLPFNLVRSEGVKYVVCCQNANVDGATELHNSAFLIGIVDTCNAADRNGKLMGVSLNITHYVLISKRDAWYAKRNVSHFFFASLAEAKIRLGRYDFTPIVKQEKRPVIVTAKRPKPAMASRTVTGKGLVKRDKFPVDYSPETVETEIVTPTMDSDFRSFIASKLGVKASQVNVTVTISI